MLAGLFVLREVASGVLKEAGKELWVWARTEARDMIVTAAAKAGSFRHPV